MSWGMALGELGHLKFTNLNPPGPRARGPRATVRAAQIRWTIALAL